MCFALAEGVRVEPMGEAWACFSALSGETLLLNTEAAAVLELLVAAPATAAEVAQQISNDTGADLADVTEALRHTWDQLESAGLVLAA